MSSAINHRKRSHRSEFRARPYRGGTRMMVGTPTLHKNGFLQFISLIRRALTGRRSHAVHKADKEAV